MQIINYEKYLLEGVYANETRDPPGCDEQAVKSW